MKVVHRVMAEKRMALDLIEAYAGPSMKVINFNSTHFAVSLWHSNTTYEVRDIFSCVSEAEECCLQGRREYITKTFTH